MSWRVKPYSELEHLHHINEWLSKRHQPDADPYDMPEIGFVSTHEGHPIASGFLRLIEGDNALFDGLASNPDKDSVIRHIGLELVVKEILEIAKSRGIKQVIAYSIDEGTLKRAYRHNFVKLPHTMIALDLKNGPSH